MGTIRNPLLLVVALCKKEGSGVLRYPPPMQLWNLLCVQTLASALWKNCSYGTPAKASAAAILLLGATCSTLLGRAAWGLQHLPYLVADSLHFRPITLQCFVNKLQLQNPRWAQRCHTTHFSRQK